MGSSRIELALRHRSQPVGRAAAARSSYAPSPRPRPSRPGRVELPAPARQREQKHAACRPAAGIYLLSWHGAAKPTDGWLGHDSVGWAALRHPVSEAFSARRLCLRERARRADGGSRSRHLRASAGKPHPAQGMFSTLHHPKCTRLIVQRSLPLPHAKTQTQACCPAPAPALPESPDSARSAGRRAQKRRGAHCARALRAFGVPQPIRGARAIGPILAVPHFAPTKAPLVIGPFSSVPFPTPQPQPNHWLRSRTRGRLTRREGQMVFRQVFWCIFVHVTTSITYIPYSPFVLSQRRRN